MSVYMDIIVQFTMSLQNVTSPAKISHVNAKNS